MPYLYTDKYDRRVEDETERVKQELGHLWKSSSIVKAEGIFFHEGGEYNLLILVKRGGGHFTVYNLWYAPEYGSANLTSVRGESRRNFARTAYDPTKHLTEQFFIC